MRIEPIFGVRLPFPPILAHAVLLLDHRTRQLDFGFVLPDIEAQPTARVPGDMAMQDPLPWIVRLEGDGRIPVAGQQDHITARGVVVFEGPVREMADVEWTIFLREEDEVVPVHMHWMGDRDEAPFALPDLFGGPLCCHDQVDPVVLVVVLRDERVLRVVKCGIVEMVD